MRNAQRDSIIASKRAARDKALASAGSYVADEHHVYTTATASEIVQMIAKGEWTASQVLEGYIARAAIAQAKTNCFTEVLFDDARKCAKELDAEFASTGQLRGPLHGVPVSFKDQYGVEGYDVTIGLTAWANNPSKKDAFLVAQFKAAGAIIIVKTNVPQTMLAFECSNPLWGCSTNPWNDQYTCGGSSGGEAALLAMDGSALGVGSDVGGSLRIPASYCGIYSLKPSVDRVSSLGAKGEDIFSRSRTSCNSGWEAVRVAYGPMGRSVQDCELFCETIFGQQDPSHQNVPLPYRPVKLSSKLRFGYYLSDGMVETSPACQRAVLETVAALEKQGHECIEFTPHLAMAAMEVFVGLLTADGYKVTLSHLKADPQESSLFLTTIGPRLPSFIRKLICWLTGSVLGDTLFSQIFSTARVKSVVEFTSYIDRRNKISAAWYEEVWDKYGFDGIIAPVQSLPGLPHGGCAYLSALSSATILYNIVESPVGTIPVTRVNPDTDEVPAGFKAGVGGRSKLFEERMYMGKNPIYDAKAMQGIPVGVQIVGKKWEDEKVLAMMRVVDDALGPRGFGPGSWKQKQAQ